MTRMCSHSGSGRVAAYMAAALVAAPSALAQQLGGATPVDIPVVQIVAGLILCSLAAFAAALFLRQRIGAGTPAPKSGLSWLARRASTDRPLRVLETHRLSAHADLCRFIANEREYVVIVTSAAITIVTDRATPASDSPQSTSRGAT